ncbi:MAG TPA: hypothetical protein GXX28_00800 [Firmicutes bacterium]|nr:hypothetical protein [Bacillota bacterium]
MTDQGGGKLAEALAKAQAEFVTPKKTKTAQVRSEKGSYSYNYADLADVFEAIRKPLATNGLSVSQRIGLFDGVFALETRLMHSSGEYLASYWPLPQLSKPQEMGSVLTYYRRYALSAIVGIAAEEDDDGTMAQAAEQKERKPAQAQQRRQTSAAQEGNQTPARGAAGPAEPANTRETAKPKDTAEAQGGAAGPSAATVAASKVDVLGAIADAQAGGLTMEEIATALEQVTGFKSAREALAHGITVDQVSQWELILTDMVMAKQAPAGRRLDADALADEISAEMDRGVI